MESKISNSSSFKITDNGDLTYTHPNFQEIVNKYLQYLHKIPESETKPQISTNINNNTTSSYRVTIIANQTETLTKESIDKYFDENPNLNSELDKLIDLGLGYDKDTGIYYILIHYPLGDKVRSFFKLKQVNFYVNIGNFGQHRNLNLSLHMIEREFEFSDSESDPGTFLIGNPSQNRTRQRQLLEWTLAHFPKSKNRKVIIELAKYYPNTNAGAKKILRLSDMLLDLNDIAGYYMKIKIWQIVEESKSSAEILRNISGTLFNFKITEEHLAQPQSEEFLNFILNFLNRKSNKGELKYYFYEFNPESDSRVIVKYQLPRNFGWVRPNLTAGSSVPDLNNIKILAKMGIKHLITCLEEPLEFSQKCCPEIKIHFFKIQDRTPPTFEQLNQMLEIFAKGEPTVVHCKGGVGRTNTVLACELIQSENVNSQEAITKIKEIRPKVILDDCQVKFIKEFSNRKYHQKSTTAGIKLPKVLMFVGYPASGKSTLSQHICGHFGEGVIRINQDEMGRKKSIDEFNNNFKSADTIVIDCSNLSKEKRCEWIDLSFQASTWCIFMDLPIEECKYRIVRRVNHRTVKNGLRILDSLENSLEVPEMDEGFEKIVKIQRDSEIDMFLQDLGITHPLNFPQIDRIIKFPRTRHLVNLGSATRDDLLFSPAEQHEFSNYELEVEEKVDGANLGILVKRDHKIQVQNRSHFVSSSYHPQFKLLDKWVMKHTDELIQILEPENEILYGEWLYMKHSLHYTRLPDYFIAFDLYNITTQTFLSRDELATRLENSTIHQVPLIVKTKFGDSSEIVDLLKQKSAFYDGLIEGVYLRNVGKEGLKTLDRAKVVRQDFICGAGDDSKNVRHWTKHRLTTNIVIANAN